MSISRRGSIASARTSNPLLTFNFPPPTITDQQDGSAVYVLGLKFSVNTPCTCVGIEYFTPLTAPIDTAEFTLWNADTELVIETKSYQLQPADLGREFQVMFTTPRALSVGVNYMATYHTNNLAPTRYTATSLVGWPQTEGPLVANASNGWYVPWNSLVYPNNVSAFANNYHVGPVVQL